MRNLGCNLFTLTLIGLGNIGTFALDVLVRLPGLRRVILVDRDVCEMANTTSQRVSAADAIRRRPKVEVQAEHARRVRPGLNVIAHHQDIADMPLGSLRADLIIAGLDSLSARLHANAAAWRLNVPWLDAGLDPSSGLVRVNGYTPSTQTPCMECTLDDEDYASRLGTIHPCSMAGANEGSTNGSPATGALAGALLTVAANNFLNSAGAAENLFGRQALWDAHHYQYFLSSYRRQPLCRFDHKVWAIGPLAGVDLETPLGELFEAIRLASDIPAGSGFALGGQRFTERVMCPGCSHVREGWHLTGRLPLPDRRCPECGKRHLAAPGFSTLPLEPAAVPASVLAMPIGKLGFAWGDVLEVGGAAETKYWEITPPVSCDPARGETDETLEPKPVAENSPCDPNGSG